MELLIPVLLIEIAIIMFVLFFVFEWALPNRDAALFALIFSTIFFFVSAACFLGVSERTTFPSYYENGSLAGVVSQDTRIDYNVFAILAACLGFLPILMLYLESWKDFEE